MRIIPLPAARRRHDFTLTMINIVFLLLLFFLTTGSLTNREEAQSAMPVTRNLPLERLPRPLLLLENDGAMFLDGRPVSAEGVIEAVKFAVATTGQADTRLNLLAPPEMPAGSLLTLAEKIRSGGVSVQLVTLHEPPEQASGSL